MPQAVSPRRPSGSAFPPPSPGQRNDRKPKAAPTLKARTNPRDWDPEKLARYYMRHGNPVTSPILAKIVLENKIDGHALCDIPEDVFSEILEDQQLAEDMRATAHDLRARAGTHVSPSSRIPRAQDIMASLASLSDAPLPSLSASPEPAEEHERPPSPYTPPPWDWSDDEDAPYPAHGSNFGGGAGFGGGGAGPTLLHFGSPGTAPHLLQPLLSLSPGAPYELSALDVPDATRAADFAADEREVHDAHDENAHEESAHEESAHEESGGGGARGDAGAGGRGDHPGLPAAHGGLPGRQDEAAGADDASSIDTWHDAPPVSADVPPAEAPQSAAPQTHAPQPAARPRLRLNSSFSSLPSRPGSCPPGLILAPYIPPRAPPAETKAFADEGVQAGADVPPAYTSVAVQTRALADAQVQTDAVGEDPLDAELVQSALGADAGETRERAEDGQEAGAQGPAPAEPAPTPAHGHDAPAEDTAEVAQAKPASKNRRKRARARAKAQGEQEETDAQEPDAEPLEAEAPETDVAAADMKDAQKEEDTPPPPPPKLGTVPANGGGDTAQEPAAPQTPVKDSKDAQPRALATLAQRSVGGRRDSSWAMGATPQSLPAVPPARSVSGSLGASGALSADRASADASAETADVSAEPGVVESPRGKATKKLFTAARAGPTHSSAGDVELRDAIAATVRSGLSRNRRVQSQDRGSGARGRRGSGVGVAQVGTAVVVGSGEESVRKREETSMSREQDASGEGVVGRQEGSAAGEKADESVPSQAQKKELTGKGDEEEVSGWELDSELEGETTGDLDAEPSNVASTTQVASTVDGDDPRTKDEAPLATPKPPPQTVQAVSSPVSDPLLLTASDIQLPAEPPAPHIPTQRRASTASTADSFVDASDALAADGEHNGTGTHGALPGRGAETLTSGSEAESAAETAQEDPDVPQTTPSGEQDADPFDVISVHEAGGADKEDAQADAALEVSPSGAVEHGGEDTEDGQAKGVNGDENGQHAAAALSDALPADEGDAQDATNPRSSAPDTKTSVTSADPIDATGKKDEHTPSPSTAQPAPANASTNGETSKVEAPETSPAENDVEADFAMVSLEEGRGAGQDDGRGGGEGEGHDAEHVQGVSPAEQARRDAEDWQDVAHPVAQPAPSKAVRPTVRVDAPQRAATTSPVEHRQMRRMPSDSRPSSTGGLNPFQPPGLRREASPGGLYSPAPKKASGIFQTIVTVASDIMTSSSPATPVTPGDDGDAEEGYFELDEAEIANMSPEERDKYYKEMKEKQKKREKKRRQALNKRKKVETGISAWFS
ncbi:hypothetical protein PsYK624_106880 [Phanerochaete sordida]|uniref:Uncharacterized protein n=1 Tax=Phanerochaete sordida TaxID=48140 RepID=A0A9P3GEC6_9APHY|nr:hypothetical protein PsYK624_106880 [Phanerochaete sordida]